MSIRWRLLWRLKNFTRMLSFFRLKSTRSFISSKKYQRASLSTLQLVTSKFFPHRFNADRTLKTDGLSEGMADSPARLNGCILEATRKTAQLARRPAIIMTNS